ncbi:aspartyl/asparaginyl beta-hydroxylase domain-containing protein [Acrocarpospora catenulata]|uniref:aspartyl/asparaginyl beta-hydroxylase domain-containing protein n=1 Tax=Acrocarpospora catenulata TaxID=2836182 RepID=UPI001BDA7F41|nr:aspartyl/asparaginyl beta-hydroxylase domain-containing protein [Acrocarpospora catenulata]
MITTDLHDDTATSTALIDQVGCLASITDTRLERLRHEALTVPTDWQISYEEYQSGGWATLSLLNGSGDPADVTITDCERPVATLLLERMPATRALLDELGLSYMWVRLARLDSNAFLWEHRDYTELNTIERYRLHLPILTNSSAYLVTAGAAVHMTAGRWWRLTPTYAHGVCNLRGPQRIHLIADCYDDEALRHLTADAHLPETGVRILPTATPDELLQHAQTAADLAALGWVEAAERSLLQLFYHYALSEGHTYDMIRDLHAGRGDAAAAAGWQAKKAFMLTGVRA